MSKKKAVYAICDGLIHATIWGHDGKDGRRYEFTLGRAYGVGDHAFRYAPTFHEQDAEALSRVIKRAAGAIREASESNENTEAEPARIDLALKAAKRYARLLNIGAWEVRRPDTGIPFIMDVSPGYDAHIVFPGSVQYGLSSSWTAALSEMAREFGQDGMIYNSWNGYTEGMAAVSTEEFGDDYYMWLQSLPRAPADLDWDGDVDIDDFAVFAGCVGGSQQPLEPGCVQADMDGDGDADLADFAAFQAAFGFP